MGEKSELASGRAASSLSPKGLWLGAGSFVSGAVAYLFAWRGGLWALPISVVLAVLALRARHRHEALWPAVGVGMAAAGLLLGAFAFVGSGGLGPAVRTDSSTYAPGDQVHVRLKAGIGRVGYNLCLARLERLDGGRWGPVGISLFPDDGETYACTLQQDDLRLLFSDDEVVYLPRRLLPGAYRISYRVEIGGEDRRIATGPFTVIR